MSRAQPGPLLPLDDALRKVLAAHGHPIAVLAGAATSRAAPASLPVVDDFYVALAEVVTAREPRLGRPERLRASLRRDVPFELLMEAWRRALLDAATDRVAELLVSVYRSASPNPNHTLLSSLVGGDIAMLMTTNFDTLLESCGGLGSAWSERDVAQVAATLEAGLRTGRPPVVHLHGSVDHPPSLGALQRRVAQPLTGARAELLRQVRRSMPLMLIGYSGSDHDIAPLLQEPGFPCVWLNRSTARFGDELVNTDLESRAATAGGAATPDPVGSTRRAIETWLDDGLHGDEAERVIGALADLAGLHLLAAEHFRGAHQLHPTAGARIGFASALAALSLFRAAARALRSGQVSAGPGAEPGELLGDRAFYRRTSGDVIGGLADYRAARTALELVAESRDRVPELLDVLWREVEAILLVASGRSSDEQRLAVAEAAPILDETRRRLDANPTVSEFVLHFYRGEVALLEGRFSDAAAEYRLFQEGAEPWSGRQGVVIAAVREAVALAAAGRRRQALRRWWAGVSAAASSLALLHVVQYVLAAPALAGRPGYLWRLRRLAPRTYPAYETLKTLAFRLRRKGALLHLDSR